MSEIENNFKSRLKNILINDKWTLKQYYPIEEGKYEIKVLFKKMPGILIWDFFSTNIINNLVIEENNIKLVSTGLDDISWRYELEKTY